MQNPSIFTSTILKLLFIVFGLSLVLLILHPYWQALAWGAIFAFACFPLLKKIQHYIANKNIAAAILTVIIALGVLLPLIFLFSTISQEILSVLDWLKTNDIKQLKLPSFIQNLPFFGKKISGLFQNYLQNPQIIMDKLKQTETSTWLTAANNSVGFVFKQIETLFFMIISLYFMLKDFPAFLHRVKKILTHTNPSYLIFLQTIYSQFQGIIKSFCYISFGVGIFMTIFFTILSLPVPLLLGAIAAVCSIIPFSSPIYYILLMLLLFFQGKILTGIILIAVCLTVTQIIDNWLQPFIISKNSKIHFLNILFGILGGIKAFGLIGVVLGPLFLSAAWETINFFVLPDTKA